MRSNQLLSGSTLMRYRLRGVKAYGFTPLILPAAAMTSMHGDAEFLPVESIGPAIQILFEALKSTVDATTSSK